MNQQRPQWNVDAVCMQDKRAELAAILTHCSDALRDQDGGNAPLRELQSFVQSQFYLESDPYVRTISFVLDEWIKDYYLNFAGDIMSPNWIHIDEIRSRLLSGQTSVALASLSEAVVAGSTDRAFVAIEQLVVTYLNAIDEANRAIEQI